jgi:hypothetical protein
MITKNRQVLEAQDWLLKGKPRFERLSKPFHSSKMHQRTSSTESPGNYGLRCICHVMKL